MNGSAWHGGSWSTAGCRPFRIFKRINSQRVTGYHSPQIPVPAGGKAMRTLTFRGVLSWLLITVMASPAFAADSAAAMMYTNGTAWINGENIPKSSAIFVGDLVQTKANSVANIKSSGTSVLVLSDSLIQYQGSAVKLEHGSLNVATSQSMAAPDRRSSGRAGGGVVD
jgi:hypothetical protein